jgi:hypothetical protein
MQYTSSEFNGENFTPDTIEDIAKKKISLLYDMRILKRGKNQTKDPRAATVKKILLAHKDSDSIDASMHKLVRFNETLDDFITRKEKELNL